MKYKRQHTDITEWHRWYAWYPVRVSSWREATPNETLNKSCIVWREYVWRKIHYQNCYMNTMKVKVYSTSEKKPT